ncbi:hypothetical protein DFH07DRAFT_766870 [Mycena maculata]|uniref:Uncharacterized protein n=1 Tax=Mycena maculata TaxID=230809 RepID=A0AAD7NV03_9AGAR|nr:hypothetical protein DFH07DRAFT_766870 [Mycena maculata]
MATFCNVPLSTSLDLLSEHSRVSLDWILTSGVPASQSSASGVLNLPSGDTIYSMHMKPSVTAGLPYDLVLGHDWVFFCRQTLPHVSFSLSSDKLADLSTSRVRKEKRTPTKLMRPWTCSFVGVGGRAYGSSARPPAAAAGARERRRRGNARGARCEGEAQLRAEEETLSARRSSRGKGKTHGRREPTLPTRSESSPQLASAYGARRLTPPELEQRESCDFERGNSRQEWI